MREETKERSVKYQIMISIVLSCSACSTLVFLGALVLTFIAQFAGPNPASAWAWSHNVFLIFLFLGSELLGTVVANLVPDRYQTLTTAVMSGAAGPVPGQFD